ncbi:MAG: GTPase [Bacteroidetes bacterium HGW-Bacteroidetes-12]|nr:MAG: GTPase [Bacteroidetes bacterium HGW-Bacteroidetes-12]
MSEELIFIYNASTGKLNSLIDFSHKIISPSTYPCSLCSLTHGDFGAKKEWKEFLEKYPLKTTFLYKNQLEHLSFLPKKFPAILFKLENNKIKELFSAEELKKISDVNELINEIKIRTLAPH